MSTPIKPLNTDRGPIGEGVKAWREENKTPQRQLATLNGVSGAYSGHIGTGQEPPMPISLLKRLYPVLNDAQKREMFEALKQFHVYGFEVLAPLEREA